MMARGGAGRLEKRRKFVLRWRTLTDYILVCGFATGGFGVSEKKKNGFLLQHRMLSDYGYAGRLSCRVP
jgi:hypothetical protein